MATDALAQEHRRSQLYRPIPYDMEYRVLSLIEPNNASGAPAMQQ